MEYILLEKLVLVITITIVIIAVIAILVFNVFWSIKITDLFITRIRKLNNDEIDRIKDKKFIHYTTTETASESIMNSGVIRGGWRIGNFSNGMKKRVFMFGEVISEKALFFNNNKYRKKIVFNLSQDDVRKLYIREYDGIYVLDGDISIDLKDAYCENSDYHLLKKEKKHSIQWASIMETCCIIALFIIEIMWLRYFINKNF